MQGGFLRDVSQRVDDVGKVLHRQYLMQCLWSQTVVPAFSRFS
jgi:hypothetical protein